MRVGYSLTRSRVTSSSSSVTFTVNIYTQNQYRYNDNQTMNLSGDKLGGNFNYSNTSGSNSSGGGAIKRATRKYTYKYTDYKKSHTLISTTLRVSGAYNGVTPSVNVKYVVPARPYKVPTAPTGVKANWSNGKPRTSWTRRDSSAGKYGTQTIQWGYYDETGWNEYRGSTVVSAGTTAYLWGSETKNRAYRYRVRANNSSGSSGWAYMPSGTYLYNNPAEVSSAKAKVNSSSQAITTTWKNNHYKVGDVSIEVGRSVNGGAWTTIKTGLSKTATSYVDANPGAGTNRYRIRVKHKAQQFDSSDLYSDYVYTNTVNTIVEPKAPTKLWPFGDVVDFTKNVTFTWQHNDGGDGADQSHINVEYRAQGDTTWTSLADNVATDVQALTIEADVLSNGITYEWRVQTQGNTTKGFGPWSVIATVTGSTQPTVTIWNDSPASVVEEMPVVVNWDYQQDQSYAQIAAELQLWTIGADDSLNEMVASESISGATTTATLDAALVDGERYILRVRARSSIGLWSEWDERLFVVDLLPPAEVTCSLEYDPDTGQMTVTLFSEEAVPGETSPAVKADVQRRIDGGEWFTVIRNVPVGLETSISDQVPTINGVNEYRFYVESEIPTYSYTDICRMTINEDNNEQWLFLNYGTAFQNVVRMRCDVAASATFDRASTTHPLLGRDKPFFMQGQQLSHEHTFTGQVLYEREKCAPVVPDNPEEMLCAPWFESSQPWIPQSTTPGSGVNPIAHYRGKKQGYLLKSPQWGALSGPAPMECGVEPELLAENIWRYSKLSENRDGVSVSSNYTATQDDDGLRIQYAADPGTGAFSLTWTNSTGMVENITPGAVYSWRIPLKNNGNDDVPIRVTAWLRNGEGVTRSTKSDTFILKPGEQRDALLEGMDAGDDGYDIRFSLYYGSGTARPGPGSDFTLMDGITLVASETVPEFSFTGEAAIPKRELSRLNRIDPSFKDGDIAGWSWPSSQLNVRTIYSHGIDNKAQVRVTATASASTVAYFGATPVPINGGDWVGFSAWFLNDVDNPYVRTRLVFRDASGSNVGSSPYITTTQQVGTEYVQLIGAAQAPADAVSVIPYSYIYSTASNSPATEGQSYYTDHWSVDTADTEAEAIASVETFFDGRGGPNSELAYRWADVEYQSVAVEESVEQPPDGRMYQWSNTPYASSSRELFVGEEPTYPTIETGKTYAASMYVRGPGIEKVDRTNLANNPSVETDEDFVTPEYEAIARGWLRSTDWASVGSQSMRVGTAFGNTGSYVSDEAGAGFFGVNDLSETVVTLGADFHQSAAIPTDAEPANIGLYCSGNYEDGSTFQIVGVDVPRYTDGRVTGTVTIPAGTETVALRLAAARKIGEMWTSPYTYYDAITLEAGVTDGSWFEGETENLLVGAQNVESVSLTAWVMKPDRSELYETVTFDTRTHDELDARWMRLSGEYTLPEEYTDALLIMFVSITTDGSEWLEDSTDWYIGGASLKEQYQYVEPELGPDSSYEDWVNAQKDAHVVCVRDPFGARFFGAMSDLSLNSVEDLLNSATVSFKVTEVLYDEKTLTHWPVLDPYVDVQTVRGPLVPPFVVDPYSSESESTSTPPLVLNPYSSTGGEES